MLASISPRPDAGSSLPAGIEVGDLTCHWFGSKTVIAAFRRLQLNEESQLLKRDPSVNSLAFMAAAPSAETPRRRLSTTAVGWKHVVNAAIDLLKSNATVRDGVASNELLPLLELGAQIGQGANCQVIEAAVGQHKEKPAMGWPSRPGVPSRLAVKVYLTGHSADRGAGAVMRDVMWEVHVLRKIQHENIVKLCDVVEFIDVRSRARAPRTPDAGRGCKSSAGHPTHGEAPPFHPAALWNRFHVFY
eukprot:2109031-Prymnesium_polylepis.2